MLIDEPEAMGRTAIKVSFGPSHTCCLEGWKIQAHEFMGLPDVQPNQPKSRPAHRRKEKEKRNKKGGEARSAGAEGADPVAAATPSIASNSFRIRTELSTILMR
jgi:hypothetical protein